MNQFGALARVALVSSGGCLPPFCARGARGHGGWVVAARYATRAVDAFSVRVGLPAEIADPIVDASRNPAGVWSLCPLDWVAEDDEDSGDWLVITPGGVPVYRLTGVPDVPPWAVEVPGEASERVPEPLPRAA